MAIFSQNRLQMLEDDELALLLATPTPTLKALQKRQNRQNRPKSKSPSINIEATLQPIIPQKRQRTLEEREEIYEFRASSGSSLFSSTTRTSPSVIPATPMGNIPSIPSILDIKDIIQSAISPLVRELTALKEEIKQLKAPQNNASAKANINKAKEIQQAPIQAQAQARKTTAAIPQIAKKPTYADIASGEPKQATEKTTKPWTIIQKRKAIPATELAPKKATEPSQRRIILQRQKNADKTTNLPNLLLALNKAIKEWGLPDHIRLIKLDYIKTGAISGFLAEKATAAILISHYSDALIKVAIQYNSNIIGISQAEE